MFILFAFQKLRHCFDLFLGEGSMKLKSERKIERMQFDFDSYLRYFQIYEIFVEIIFVYRKY